jgi:drug/metabolite transporter (DMT)-like permease
MVLEKVITFVVCALFMSLLLVLWQQGDLGGMPDLATLRAAGYWLLLIAVLMLPITWLTIWPATMLSPGRVGMLLLAEVLVGVTSAALLLDEPFGMRELAGAVLIVTAGVVEVVRRQKLSKSGIVEPRPTPD